MCLEDYNGIYFDGNDTHVDENQELNEHSFTFLASKCVGKNLKCEKNRTKFIEFTDSFYIEVKYIS